MVRFLLSLVPLPLIACSGVFVAFLFASLIAVLFVRRDSLSWKGKFLYYWTLMLELPGVAARFFVFLILAPALLTPVWVVMNLCFTGVVLVLLIVYRLKGETFPMAVFTSVAGGIGFIIAVILVFLVAFWAAWGPIITSIFSLLGILKGGQRYHRWSTGARTIGRERELPLVMSALASLEANAPQPFKKPTYLFVLDTDSADAYSVGNAMYLTRGLIHKAGYPEPHLMAMLAHQLGHCTSADARLTLALRRLVITPMYFLSSSLGQLAPGMVSIAARFAEADTYIVSVVTWFLNLFLAAAGGGMGLLLLNIPWTWFWRERDYQADAFAATLGQAQPLIEYLDKHQGFDVATPYYMSPQPYTELRIDALMQYLKTPSRSPTSTLTQPLPVVL